MEIEVVSFEESEKMGLVPVDEYLTGHLFKEDIYPHVNALKAIYPHVKFYVVMSFGYYRIRAAKVLTQYEILESFKNQLETIPDLIKEARAEYEGKINRLVSSQETIQLKIEAIEKSIKESQNVI